MTVWFLIIGLSVFPHAYPNERACLVAMGEGFYSVSERAEMICVQSGEGYAA